jgi:hypothetical protein
MQTDDEVTLLGSLVKIVRKLGWENVRESHVLIGFLVAIALVIVEAFVIATHGPMAGLAVLYISPAGFFVSLLALSFVIGREPTISSPHDAAP